jgi:hypothetical protein
VRLFWTVLERDPGLAKRVFEFWSGSPAWPGGFLFHPAAPGEQRRPLSPEERRRKGQSRMLLALHLDGEQRQEVAGLVTV